MEQIVERIDKLERTVSKLVEDVEIIKRYIPPHLRRNPLWLIETMDYLFEHGVEYEYLPYGTNDHRELVIPNVIGHDTRYLDNVLIFWQDYSKTYQLEWIDCRRIASISHSTDNVLRIEFKHSID